jgi:hypothetical protein
MPNKPGTRMRGYGAHHVALRKRWLLLVQTGQVFCARCGRLIEVGAPWDLGHDDQDRTVYSGPEHARCNRGAPRRKQSPLRSRDW